MVIHKGEGGGGWLLIGGGREGNVRRVASHWWRGCEGWLLIGGRGG